MPFLPNVKAPGFFFLGGGGLGVVYLKAARSLIRIWRRRKWLFVSGAFQKFRKTTVTYLLTPWCRVLLEKLTGLQLVKKFPAFHGTRRFITALTSVRYLSLSWASPIQFIYPHPTSWRSILIVSTHLRLGLPSGLLPSGFPTKTLYTPSPRPYAPHAQPISFFSILSPAQYWVRSTNHLAPRYAVSSIPENYCYLHYVCVSSGHATTRPPRDGFSWNLIFENFFLKICGENSSLIKIWEA